MQICRTYSNKMTGCQNGSSVSSVGRAFGCYDIQDKHVTWISIPWYRKVDGSTPSWSDRFDHDSYDYQSSDICIRLTPTPTYLKGFHVEMLVIEDYLSLKQKFDKR